MGFIFSGGFEFTIEEPTCPICGKQITESKGPPYCPEHLLQYERRQRLGVPTDELSEQWEDTLDNWRDRPPELDVELGTRGASTQLLFERRGGDWVLFQRRYYQDFRLPDTLAVNLRTGEIRRFVEASDLDIADELHRGRPVPHQEELLAHWGQPDFHGMHTHLTQPAMDARHPLALPDYLPFPVYGLVGNPLDLAVCSSSRGHDWQRLTSAGLTFSSPRYPEVRENFELVSSDAYNRSGVRRPRERTTPVFWEGECRIAGQVFRGTIERWSFPQHWQEFANQLPPGLSLPEWELFYDLQGEETNLFGKVQGPSVEEVLELLQGAVVVNDRADLREQYQRELDEEDKRLFGQYEDNG